MSVRYLKIDEDGYLMSDEGHRLEDPDFTHSVFSGIQKGEFGAWTSTHKSTNIILEAFDEPLVAQQILKQGDTWTIQCIHEWFENFSLESLSLDPWDRFHGYTERGVAFVMSRKAQSEFFNLLDEFDDDSITSDEKKITIPDWLIDNTEANKAEFWGEKYLAETTPWDQKKPNTTFTHYLPKLKLARSKVAVLGCGKGHDAFHFAEAGHIVEAYDFEKSAIDIAKKLYQKPDLTFKQADVFQLIPEHIEDYDVVFEHTLYCAINPSDRGKLVDIWRRLLRRKGFLMGVFFSFDRRQGPPFGGSDWELRQRLSKYFDILYWQRSRHSTVKRSGTELFVLAQKK